MRKKLLALLLAVCLLLAAVPLPAGAVSDVCFVAINDTMPESIPLAYVKDNVAYIPCSALNGFRIYNLYDANISTVLVYTSFQQITIDMNAGIATDKDGLTYAATAVFRNGQVYVPAAFICSMFGLQASYIEGNGVGDICRITDGSEVLGDSLFLSAATNLMRTRYNAYQQSIAPTPAVTPSNGRPDPSPVKSTIYLTFLGLPTNYLLNLLKNYQYTATFFLTEADIVASPDTVRRIVGDGHYVGIYCQDGTLTFHERAAELLFEAAHIRTVLVTAGSAASPAFSEACRDAGLIACQYDIDGISGKEGFGSVSSGYMIGRLNNAEGDTVLTAALTSKNDTAVRAVVTYLYSNDDQFDLSAVREVGYTGGTRS